jgi:hypothetical protein
MPIKSFRGLLAEGAIDQLFLHTRDGSIGYRIVKFTLMPHQPGVGGPESVVKIYKTTQTAADGDVDFSDQTLLAAAFQKTQEDSANTNVGIITIFDQEIFNQDIYITNKDMRGSHPVNYYIELEQIKLDMNQNTVATLKDIRNTIGTI